MPTLYTTLLFWKLPTFTLLLGVGGVLTLALLLWQTRGIVPPGRVTDVFIAGIIGALVAARGLHVLLHWNYFDAHRQEIFSLAQGGLSWHGAAVGGWLASSLAARLQGFSLRVILPGMAAGLCVVMFSAWWGCGAALCAYGREVQNLSQYPSWLVWEAPDIFGTWAPRYNTQSLGMAAAAALLPFALWRQQVPCLRWTSHAPVTERRFWTVLAACGLVMLVLGFLRGDQIAAIAGLRADQWLDGVVVLLAVAKSRYNGGVA